MIKERTFIEDTKATSPVIGVMLMIVVTVILAASITIPKYHNNAY